MSEARENPPAAPPAITPEAVDAAVEEIEAAPIETVHGLGYKCGNCRE